MHSFLQIIDKIPYKIAKVYYYLFLVVEVVKYFVKFEKGFSIKVIDDNTLDLK